MFVSLSCLNSTPGNKPQEAVEPVVSPTAIPSATPALTSEEIVTQPEDPVPFDIADCWPQAADYALAIANLSDGSTPGGKHSCNADGMITNNSEQVILVARYRVNHYGNEAVFGEGWANAYFILNPGETIEYGSFHRCTGGNCGEGEWFYIEKLSLMADESECFNYSEGFEDKPPESIVIIENPCDW